MPCMNPPWAHRVIDCCSRLPSCLTTCMASVVCSVPRILPDSCTFLLRPLHPRFHPITLTWPWFPQGSLYFHTLDPFPTPHGEIQHCWLMWGWVREQALCITIWLPLTQGPRGTSIKLYSGLCAERPFCGPKSLGDGLCHAPHHFLSKLWTY